MLRANRELFSQLGRLAARLPSLRTMFDERREAERRWRAVYDNSSVGIGVADAAGRIVAANRTLRSMLGHAGGELRKFSLFAAAGREDEDAGSSLARLHGGAPEIRFERRFRRRDGSTLWAQISVSILQATGNAPAMFICIVEDITERRRAEKECLAVKDQLATEVSAMLSLRKVLRRTEAYLAAGQTLIRAASWALNVSSGELDWSPEHCRIVGVEPGTVSHSYEGFLAMVHPEDRFMLRDRFEAAVHEGAPFEAHYRMVCPDGAVRHLHCLSYPFFNGDQIEYVGTVIDATECKQVEEQLRDSERRFDLLAEAIPHHVWCSGTDGRLTYWNRQLAAYTGLEAGELERGGWAAVHSGDVERAKAAWHEARSAASPYEVEQRMRGRDGQFRRFLCRAVPIKDEQGRLVGYLGTNTDIEECRQAQEELHGAKAELARVARVLSMGELTASIAHEVNQPLAAVVTNAEASLRWLAAAPPNLQNARDSVQRIIRDARLAGDVITRIRTFLRRGKAQKAAVRLPDVIAEVVNLVQAELHAHDVRVRVRTASDLPAVLGDRVELEQVIVNLALNAIEAMSSSEGVRVLEIRTEKHGSDGLLVSVHDSGRGLPAAQMDRLFDAFYTTKPHGMGMGLAISRSIIEAHGGRLWATQNGEGATFQFLLPLAGHESGSRKDME